MEEANIVSASEDSMDSDNDDQFQLNMQRDEESKAYEKSVKA